MFTRLFFVLLVSICGLGCQDEVPLSERRAPPPELSPHYRAPDSLESDDTLAVLLPKDSTAASEADSISLVFADTLDVPPSGATPPPSPLPDPDRPVSAPNMPVLIIPVDGIGPDDLIDTFTQARSGGRSHDAIDIIAPRGTPVRAAVEGVIVRLFNSERGGLTIYQLDPDSTTVYYYAHLDQYAEGLKAGHVARQGEIIGYVGDTGNAVPGNYHLHFAIWRTDDPRDFWDGDTVNPYPLLREALSAQ